MNLKRNLKMRSFMNFDPFFSIVIPVYNRCNLLGNTISSILQQTFGAYEVIIIDDGSTDDTLNFLKKNYGDKPNFKIISQPNRERGAARNTGFKNASGTYVIFFDSDDLMHPNHLQVLHRGIIENNHPYFIATKFDFINDKGRSKASDIMPIKEGFYDYRLFLNGNPIACNVCVLADNPDIKLFEEDRNFAIKEDWMFLIQNSKLHKLFIIDEVTISMSDHPLRSMRSDNDLIIQKTLLAKDWILRKIDLTTEEKSQLSAHVNYFCAIHSYLESQSKRSIGFLIHAIKFGGFKMKYFTLLLKSILGRKLISRIQ